jgi:hypothetical protein
MEDVLALGGWRMKEGWVRTKKELRMEGEKKEIEIKKEGKK